MREPAASLRSKWVVEGKINECGMSLMIIVVIVSSVVHFHLFALELALNSFSIGRVTNERKDGTNAFHQQHTLTRFCVIEGSLNAVVTKRVSQQLLQTTAIKKLLDEQLAGVMLSDTDAFFNHVGAEFLNGQGANVSKELTNDRITKPVVVEIENILNNIIAIRILDESQGVISYLRYELDSLRL